MCAQTAGIKKRVNGSSKKRSKDNMDKSSSSSSSEGEEEEEEEQRVLVIDKRAVVWRDMHEDNEECKSFILPCGMRKASCPKCIVLPALIKLEKIAAHPALLQYDSSVVHNGTFSLYANFLYCTIL